MADTIYNFFTFLEKKAGKTLSPEKNFNLKLAHAKELIDNKDLDALPFKQKLKYCPERIDNKDLDALPFTDKLIYCPQRIGQDELTVDGNLFVPYQAKALPNGLTVNGLLNISWESDLETTPENIKAESVTWGASSDLYPKSFNGATFKDFNVGSACSKLPEGIKVTNQLKIAESGVESIPNGLKLNRLEAQSSKLKFLPAQLECNYLDIRKTAVTEIPEGVVVNKKLSVSEIPKKYPKRLEDIISVGGHFTIGQIKKWEALPDLSVSVGRKVKKGKGFQEPLSKISEKSGFIEYMGFRNIFPYVERATKACSKLFNITWDTVTVLVKKGNYDFETDWILSGKDNKGREVMLYDNNALISAEGQVSTKSFNSSWNLSKKEVDRLLFKLFPKSQEGEPPAKAVNIRTLMNDENSKDLHWRIGRKNRGGFGTEGNAKDLIPTLSSATISNIEGVTTRRNITWDKMIVFDNNGAINLVIHGKTPEGEDIYFDKYGYGQGGSWRVFEGPKYEDLS